MTDPPPFGKTLARLRKQVGLTQTDLAKLSGMSRGTVATLEVGRDPRTRKAITPRVETIRSLADALGLNRQTAQPDPDAADCYYLDLATAAGYFSNQTLAPRERAQALLARNPRIATAFEAFPANMDDDDVDALLQHLDYFAQMLWRNRTK